MGQQNDVARRVELEELRREVEKERRDAMNKMRYEFEEFVHKKIDKIFEEVEMFMNVENDDDANQQVQIDSIFKDMNRLKNGLQSVSASWRDLVANSLHG